MGKIAVFDDYPEYANMAAAPLQTAGHNILMVTYPIDWERVVQFGPQAISVGLYRKRIAFNRPIIDWTEDILGYLPLKEMEAYPAIQVIPICLVGSALEEQDVPTSVNYDVFLSFPEDIHIYLPKMEELIQKVKTRRKISGYLCPKCRSRLVFLREPAVDLFCPRCHTAVAIIDDRDCLTALAGEGPSLPCRVVDLLPPDRTGRVSPG